MVMLLLTGSTLNIESFMGAIMAVGVAVANAVLLVTFARAENGGSASVARDYRGLRPAAQADSDDDAGDGRGHAADGIRAGRRRRRPDRATGAGGDRRSVGLAVRTR